MVDREDNSVWVGRGKDFSLFFFLSESSTVWSCCLWNHLWSHEKVSQEMTFMWLGPRWATDITGKKRNWITDNCCRYYSFTNECTQYTFPLSFLRPCFRTKAPSNRATLHMTSISTCQQLHFAKMKNLCLSVLGSGGRIHNKLSCEDGPVSCN